MTKRIRVSSVAVWITLLIACSNQETVNSPGRADAPKTMIRGIVTKPSAQSKTENRKTVFPDEAMLKIKVLTTGSFHEDEVGDGVDRELWFGLFRSEKGYYLAKTAIKTEKVYDPIVDEDQTLKTGWQVGTFSSDSALLLMEALPIFSDRKIQRLVAEKSAFYPGDSLAFSCSGTTYQLYATGVNKKLHNNNAALEIRDYKLYLATTVAGKRKSQLLVAQPSFDDTMTEILFIGDIDGDNLPDFIIDTSGHYNQQKITLYLSRFAAKGEIVKPAGAHRFVGC